MNDVKSEFHTSQYILRDARENDINSVFELSHLLNTVNLPAKKSELELVIANSEKAFSLQEKDVAKQNYLFVMTDSGDKVIGTSQIFTKHGVLSCPHLYFQVERDDRYSETLKKYFRHRTLRLCQDLDGPTELGSLVLSKNYRLSKEKLGRSLSYVRFLFIFMRRELFSDRFLAELLPPLGDNGESSLWDAIGRKFTGLEYLEADAISRNNKEFIKTLFPSEKIFVTLLPADAQDIIGQVGEKSQGAAHLLSKIGFRYNQRVDPFDGGPHYEADYDDISLFKSAILAPNKCLETVPKDSKWGLCGRFFPKKPSGDRFRAVSTRFFRDVENDVVLMPKAAQTSLGISDGERVFVIDYTD